MSSDAAVKCVYETGYIKECQRADDLGPMAESTWGLTYVQCSMNASSTDCLLWHLVLIISGFSQIADCKTVH